MIILFGMMYSLPPWCDLFLFPLVIICVLGFGSGVLRILTRLLPEEIHLCRQGNLLDIFFLSAGLGYGALALLMFLLGALRLYYPPVLWMVLTVGIWLFLTQRQGHSWREVWQTIRPEDKSERDFFIIALIILFIQFTGCFQPAIGQDELTYHLTAPWQYLVAHRIHPTPNLLHANFPFNAQMIYLFCLGLGGEILCKLVQFSQWLVILPILMVWTKSFLPGTGYLALLLYLGAIAGVYVRAPMEAGSDILLSLYFTLSFYCVFRMRRETLPGWLLAAGIFNGLAWGTKYVAPAFVTPALSIYILWRLFHLRPDVRKAVFGLCVFGAASLILFLPWMAKNAVFTGNPVYPLANRIFHSPPPYDAIAERLYEYEDEWNFYKQSRQIGVSPNLLEMALLALENYQSERLEWSLHEGDYLLLLYLIFSMTGLLIPIQGLRPLAAAGLTGNLLFMVIYGTHLNRFFSMTYPLAALLIAVQLVYLLRQVSIGRTLILLLGLATFISYLQFQWQWCHLIQWYGKPLLTREAHRQYLIQRFDNAEEMGMWDSLPEWIPPDGYLLSHGVRYPLRTTRRVYATAYFEKELFDLLFEEKQDGKGVHQELLNQGFTHILISRDPDYPKIPASWLDLYTTPVWEGTLLEIHKIKDIKPKDIHLLIPVR